MTIYTYMYSANKKKMTIQPVEVTETAKTYRSETFALLSYLRVINKNELDTIKEEYSMYYMVSLKNDKNAFAEKLRLLFIDKVEATTKQLQKYEAIIASLNQNKCKCFNKETGICEGFECKTPCDYAAVTGSCKENCENYFNCECCEYAPEN